MPLQNRVTPFDDIVAIPLRGLFTGNRGIMHDPASHTLLKRRWAHRRAFRAGYRPVLHPDLVDATPESR